MGFNVNKEGLLVNRALREVVCFDKVLRYDWVHSALQDGMLTCEIWLFVEKCESLELLSFADLEQYLKQGWQYPKHFREKSGQLHRIFSTWREKADHDNDKLKCSASEALGLYSLLRHFVEVRVGHREELVTERRSFDAACAIIDLILDCKRGHAAPADTVPLLRDAQARFMQAHVEAYGTTHVRPKHHWLGDIADQIEEDCRVLDQLVIERIHLRCKAAVENVDNTTQFERSALAAALILQQHALQAGVRGDQLVGAQQAWPGRPDVVVADRLDYGGLVVTLDDFVLWNLSGSLADQIVGKVSACLRERGGHLYVLLKPMDRVRDISRTSSVWRFAPGPEVIARAERLEGARAWYWTGDELTLLYC